ncbi:MAG: hypothetical protein M3419_04930 [Actinomycetota bacterium]|nr:hypothetical protein [Actinomycetota bacterium]
MTAVIDVATSAVLSAPAPTPRRAATPTSFWRSGRCAALQHAFDMTVEATPEVISVIQQVIEPFRRREPAPPSLTEIGAPHEVSHYAVTPYHHPSLRWQLRVGDKRLAGGVTATDLLRMLTWHLNHTTIERSSSRFVLLHAAAATRHGLTVILPADQECGKSTTVSGLLREGWDYVTDEAVAIDPATGWLTPFCKNLSLDSGSWHLFPECRPSWVPPVGTVQSLTREVRQWQVPPSWLGATIAPGRVTPPRLVVFPKYVAGAATRCWPISRAEAVRQLALTTFNFPEDPQRNLEVLARVVASATVARLQIGSLDGALDAIETLASTIYLEDM